MPFCSKHFPDTTSLTWSYLCCGCASWQLSKASMYPSLSKFLPIPESWTLQCDITSLLALAYKRLSPEADGEEDLLSFSSYKSALASIICSSETEQQTVTSLFFSPSLPCTNVQLFTISFLLFSVLSTYSSPHVFVSIYTLMNYLLPNVVMYLSFPCWPTSALLQIPHFPRKSSTNLIFAKRSPVILLLCPVCLLQHKVIRPYIYLLHPQRG